MEIHVLYRKGHPKLHPYGGEINPVSVCIYNNTVLSLAVMRTTSLAKGFWSPLR